MCVIAACSIRFVTNEWWAGENPIVLCSGAVYVLIRWRRFVGPGFCCSWNK